jgi:hypothetical protein
MENTLKYNQLITYTNTIDEMFFALVNPPSYAPYQVVKRWLQWANGYDPTWHNNYIPTHLGRTIIQLLTNKIFDTGLKYEYSGSADKANAILAWLSDSYSDESNFEQALKQMTEYGQSSGTALLKADTDLYGHLIWSAVRQDRFKTVFSGSRLVEAEVYSAVLDGIFQTQKLILIEKRYYNEKRDPVVKYYIQVVNNQTSSNQWVLGSQITSIDNLKGKTQEYVKAKLGNKQLDTAYPIKMDHLGIYVYKNTATSAFLDGLNVGDSSIANAAELLAEYDKAYTLMTIDLAQARGQVLLPDDMLPKVMQGSENDFYTYLSMVNQLMNQTIFKKIKYSNPEEQKPVSIQFELRAQEWTTSLNTQLQEILVRVMASPSSIAPFLNDGSAKTATEINAIEHNTVNYINDKRSILKKIANKALKDIMKYYSKEGSAFVVFNSPGLNNDQQMSEKAIKEYNAGVRSKRSTIRACNPSWTSQEVDEELKRLSEEEMPLEDEVKFE